MSGQVRTGQVRSAGAGALSQVVRYGIRTGRYVLRLARSFLRIGICRLGGWRVTPMKGRPAGVGAFSSDVLPIRGKVIAYGWIWSVGIRLRDLLALNGGGGGLEMKSRRSRRSDSHFHIGACILITADCKQALYQHPVEASYFLKCW